MKSTSNFLTHAFRLVCIGSVIFLSAAVPFKAAPDFSGTWRLNDAKSELGQFGGRMAAKKMNITADAVGLAVTKSVLAMTGETEVMTEKYTFDGKEIESAWMMNSKRKSTAKWSADGQMLMVSSVTTFDMQGTAMEIKGTETWKIVDGMLEINTTASGANFPEMKSKMVYDKEK